MQALILERAVTHRRSIFLCQKELEVFATCADVVSVLCSCEALRRVPQLFPIFYEWSQDIRHVSDLSRIHQYKVQKDGVHMRTDNAKNFCMQTLNYICLRALPIFPEEAEIVHTLDTFGATAAKNGANHRLFPLAATQWEFIRDTCSKYNSR